METLIAYTDARLPEEIEVLSHRPPRSYRKTLRVRIPSNWENECESMPQSNQFVRTIRDAAGKVVLSTTFQYVTSMLTDKDRKFGIETIVH
jgi:hypothetical protein